MELEQLKKKYPFINAWAEGKLSEEVFIRNFKEFLKQDPQFRIDVLVQSGNVDPGVPPTEEEIDDMAKWTAFAIKYYFTTYDAFSEASRNNSLKVKTLISLIGSRKRLFEIGPGTGPLLRRLVKEGYDVKGIDYEKEMINQMEKIAPFTRGRVEHANVLEYNFANKSYDVIFIESGVFLFTILDSGDFFFESLFREEDEIEATFRKIYNALTDKGLFLIGTQGMMSEVNFSGITFYMDRTQKEHRVVRKIRFYKDKKLLYISPVQVKLSMSYHKFVLFAKNMGFRNVFISNGEQWVVLEK